MFGKLDRKRAYEVARSALRTGAISDMQRALKGLPDTGEKANDLRRRLEAALEKTPPGSTHLRKRGTEAMCLSDGLEFSFRIGSTRTPSVFDVRHVGARVTIVLNSEHPFVRRLEASGEWASPAVLTLLAGWARFELEQPDGRLSSQAADARTDWGRAVRRLLDADPKFGDG
ncbi:MAG: hypothetical protein HS104_27030 [Polyangiaceae bacterium]|nr:hypothetical protein [Polyangiaceae bacterium]